MTKLNNEIKEKIIELHSQKLKMKNIVEEINNQFQNNIKYSTIYNFIKTQNKNDSISEKSNEWTKSKNYIIIC